MHEQQFCQLSHIDVSSVHMLGSIPVLAKRIRTNPHDSIKRLLERQPHHTEALYNEAKRMVKHDKGVLVIDDSTLDKPYSHQIDMLTRHWSGKHHQVVQGINLSTSLIFSPDSRRP